MSVTVTVRDDETGEVREAKVPDGEFFILCTEPAHVEHMNTFKNGTCVITVKGRTQP